MQTILKLEYPIYLHYRRDGKRFEVNSSLAEIQLETNTGRKFSIKDSLFSLSVIMRVIKSRH